jgi:signal transduction histidine kinase
MLDTGTSSLLVAGLTVLAAATSYALAWYSWRHADHPLSSQFAALLVVDGTWALCTVLAFVSPTGGLARMWGLGTGGAGALAGALWFTFATEYTGDAEWIPDVVKRGAVGQALIYGVLYVANPSGLVYTDAGVARWGYLRLPYEAFGPIALVELGVVYALLLVSFVLLGRFVLRTRTLYRKQTGLIFGSTFVVAVSSLAFFAGLTPHPRLDVTPVFFVVQAVGVAVALYYYDFLNVAPMAANTLFEELSDPVFLIDDEGRIVDHNDAAEPYIDPEAERPTLSDVTIQGLAGVLGRSEPAGTPGDGWSRRRGGTEVSTVRERGGRLRPVTYDARVTTIADRYGRVCGYAMVLRDVTERIAQRRALESQNERLEQFAGVVSHDLRNPLSVIDGYIELAQETGDVDRLDAARRGVERMETLIDDLLRLAREGRAIDETEPVSLARCSREAWRGVDTTGAALVVETDSVVEADPSRLRQALENLFRNSVEHGSAGGRPQTGDAAEHDSPEVTVTVTVGDLTNGFYVADDGPGIPDGAHERVFELGETSSEDGTGFGLAIVERIVDAHGWEVVATAGEDGGARFEVTESFAPRLREPHAHG